MFQCPKCMEDFMRRKAGCCPNCGVKLYLQDGVAVTEMQRVSAMRVYEEFVAMAEERGTHYWNPKGSKTFIRELSVAKKLVDTARGYLKSADIDYNPEKFLVSVMRKVMEGNSGSWILEGPSLTKFNGKVFSSAAPQVLKDIRSQEKASAFETTLSTIDAVTDGMMVLG